MNKTELIAKVADKSDITKKDAEKAVSAVIDTIVEAVAAGEKVQIVGFGTFEQRARKSRENARKEAVLTRERMRSSRSRLPRFLHSRQARASRTSLTRSNLRN